MVEEVHELRVEKNVYTGRQHSSLLAVEAGPREDLT